MSPRRGAHCLHGAIHEVGAIAAMDMHIDVPRANQSAIRIDAFATLGNGKFRGFAY